MSLEREFKPCPFCGSEAELRKNSESFDQTQGLAVNLDDFMNMYKTWLKEWEE